MISLLSFDEYARAVLLAAALVTPGCASEAPDGGDPQDIPADATPTILEGCPVGEVRHPDAGCARCPDELSRFKAWLASHPPCETSIDNTSSTLTEPCGSFTCKE